MLFYDFQEKDSNVNKVKYNSIFFFILILLVVFVLSFFKKKKEIKKNEEKKMQLEFLKVLNEIISPFELNFKKKKNEIDKKVLEYIFNIIITNKQNYMTYIRKLYWKDTIKLLKQVIVDSNQIIIDKNRIDFQKEIFKKITENNIQENNDIDIFKIKKIKEDNQSTIIIKEKISVTNHKDSLEEIEKIEYLTINKINEITGFTYEITKKNEEDQKERTKNFMIKIKENNNNLNNSEIMNFIAHQNIHYLKNNGYNNCEMINSFMFDNLKEIKEIKTDEDFLKNYQDFQLEMPIIQDYLHNYFFFDDNFLNNLNLQYKNFLSSSQNKLKECFIKFVCEYLKIKLYCNTSNQIFKLSLSQNIFEFINCESIIGNNIYLFNMKEYMQILDYNKKIEQRYLEYLGELSV